MKTRIIVIVLLLITAMIWLPAGGSISAQDRGRGHGRWDHDRGDWLFGKHGKRRGPKYAFGYRNYGQYRRTQVGNRRFRTSGRYYWRNGIRVSRRSRVYY